MVKFNLIVLGAIILSSCSNDNECFNTQNDSIVQSEIKIDSISIIELFNKIVFSYMESTENKLVLEFPSQLQNEIKTELHNYQFSIRNNISCKLLRNNSKDKIKATLYQKTLPKVILRQQASFINH